MPTKTKEEESTALTIAVSTDVAEYDYGDDEHEGNDARPEDYILPLLYLLQANSPQVEKEGEKIEGARPGMFYDGSTDALYPGAEGLLIIPTFLHHCFVEWTPRKKRDDGTTGSGQGKGRTFEVDAPEIGPARDVGKKNGRAFWDLRTADTDNDLLETIYLYGLVVISIDPIRYAPIVFPVTSTKIGPYKKWNGKRLRYRTPAGKEVPIMSHMLRLKSFQDERDGDPFYNITTTPEHGQFGNSLLPKDHELYDAARSFREQIKGGLFSMSDESRDAGTPAAAGDSEEEGEGEEEEHLF